MRKLVPPTLVALAMLGQVPAATPVRAAAAPRAPRSGIVQFHVPSPGSAPYGLAIGADGAVWFAESATGRIGRLAPQTGFKEFPIPNFEDTSPHYLTLGPTGSLWFTQYDGDLIGNINRSGHITNYPIPTGFAQAQGIAEAPDRTIWFAESSEFSQIGILTPPLNYITEVALGGDLRPNAIAAGPDGAMWFTNELGNSIGRMTVKDHQLTLYSVPTESALPYDITAGPDGAMWFTELAGRNIGRITMDGQITEFPVPSGFGSIIGITTGFDGNLWFLQSDDQTLGSITPDGQFGPFYDTLTLPNDIAAGPDGGVWLTERQSNAIGYLPTLPSGDAGILSTDAGFIKRSAKVALGGTATWLFQGPKAASVADDTGLFEFDGEAVGSLASYTYSSAGTFTYHNVGKPDLRGSITVAPETSATGEAGASFPVTWAKGAPPAGSLFDVEVRATGTSWTSWKTGVRVGSARFVPASAGTYDFRARVRNVETGVASGWSPPARTEVTDAARRFWSVHGYLVADPARYERLKQAATARALGGSAPATEPMAASGLDPVAGPSFEGQNDLEVGPPDPTGAIGPNGYVQTINRRIAIYDRNGALVDDASFEEFIGGNQTHYSDPQVIWDPHTERFYYVVWDTTSATFRWGFSKTDDPTALDTKNFCRYITGFGYSPFDGPDYPKLGQTTDFLLIGVNFFKHFTEFHGGDLLWIRKPQTRGPIATCPKGPKTGRIAALTNEQGQLVNAPEPAVQVDPSRNGYVVGIPFTLDGNGDSLTIFAVSQNPKTGDPRLGAPHTIPVAPYSYPAYAPQCGDSNFTLDTLDDRLMHAVSAIDPTTGRVVVWTAQSVFGGAGSEVRWYEIAPQPGGQVTMAQSGVVNDPTLLAFNGTISPDRTVNRTGRAHGDSMVVNFSTSSPSDCPAIGMVSKIGAGTQSPIVIVKQSSNGMVDFTCVPICRWGDYSGAVPDPAAPLDAAHGTVWLDNEFALDGGGAGTWIWQAVP